jgi:hypothetical protein
MKCRTLAKVTDDPVFFNSLYLLHKSPNCLFISGVKHFIILEHGLLRCSPTITFGKLPGDDT